MLVSNLLLMYCHLLTCTPVEHYVLYICTLFQVTIIEELDSIVLYVSLNDTLFEPILRPITVYITGFYTLDVGIAHNSICEFNYYLVWECYNCKASGNKVVSGLCFDLVQMNAIVLFSWKLFAVSISMCKMPNINCYVHVVLLHFIYVV